MNERIRQLMIQAISDVDSIDDPETRRMYIPNCFAEKFAELIVKECSYLADQAHHKATGGKSAGGYIRQHFGVDC